MNPTGILDRMHRTPYGLLRRGLFVLAFNTTLAGLVALFAPQGFEFRTGVVYAQCIGLLTWAQIEAVSALLVRTGRHVGGLGTGALLMLGVSGGYLLGSLLGDRLTGMSTLSVWSVTPMLGLRFFIVSTVAGLVVAAWFVGRAHLSSARAEAEAARRLAAEAQLRLLQSQLEPHMLFNTLANLRVLIALDAPQAQAMLDRLIAFLRATLAASRLDTHPLSAEFARLADYLALMQVRMGARLQVSLDLPQALSDLPVPPLLLQPLVENAIQHGLEPAREGGRLVVSARRTAIGLRLQVDDSGCGLPEAAADAPSGRGFGLLQIRERLAVLYGQAAQLTLTRRPDGPGTLATIDLPLTPRQEPRP